MRKKHLFPWHDTVIVINHHLKTACPADVAENPEDCSITAVNRSFSSMF